jgi:hypothetical protein
VLFTLPAPHLAFVSADEPTASSYSPTPGGSWNPTGGAVTVTRIATGEYSMTWFGIDPEIIEGGNVQVSAAQSGNVQCKATSVFESGVIVRCFYHNGRRADWRFTAMLGS